MKYFVHVRDFIIIHLGDYSRIYKSRKRVHSTNFSYMVKFLGWTLGHSDSTSRGMSQWSSEIGSVANSPRLYCRLSAPLMLLRRSRRRDIWPSLPAILMAIMATVKMHPHVRPAMHCITCEIVVVSRFIRASGCLLEAELKREAGQERDGGRAARVYEAR